LCLVQSPQGGEVMDSCCTEAHTDTTKEVNKHTLLNIAEA